MAGIVETISAAFGAVREVFGWRREQANRLNTPEMKAAAKGQADQDLKDEAARAIAAKDINEIRRKLSE